MGCWDQVLLDLLHVHHVGAVESTLDHTIGVRGLEQLVVSIGNFTAHYSEYFTVYEATACSSSWFVVWLVGDCLRWHLGGQEDILRLALVQLVRAH